MTVLIKKLLPSEWESAFPIIAQLRNITKDEFLKSVRVQTLNGYELVAAVLEERIIGVMGMRPVHTLARGSHCSGQQKLATALEFFQNNRSDSFGVKPPLY